MPAIRSYSALLLLAGALSAQTTGTISGRVVSASEGAGIRKATVLLRAARLNDGAASTEGDSYLAQTDENGRFVLAGVTPGAYEAVASRTGFEAKPPGRPETSRYVTRISVPAGQSVAGVTLRLMPLGAISGRILDPDGRPVADAEVYAMQYGYSAEGKTMLPRVKVTSDDRGDFRLFGLYPGTYYVRAVPLEDGAVSRYSSFGPAGVTRNRMQMPRAEPQDASMALMPGYYPSAPDPGEARAVELPPGGDIRSIDIRLPRDGLHSVSGKVPADAEGVVFIERRSVVADRSMWARPITDGAFSIPGLSPGSYVLTSRYGDPATDECRFARLDFDIADRDIDDLSLQYAKCAQISGVLKVVGNTNVAAGVNLTLQTTSGRGGMMMFRPGPDGGFAIKNLVPDLYGLDVGPPAVPTYIQSIRAGDTELPYTLLDLRRPLGKLVLTVSTYLGGVEGAVVDEAGQPVSGAYVTLIPDQTKWNWRARYQDVDADSEGHFSFGKVVPGRYMVMGWTDAERGAPRDPAFRKAYEKSAESVQVKPNVTTRVALKVIE
jgi:hypothetical protein